MKQDSTFWDNVAVKYAQKPISDTDAYEQTLDRIVANLPENAHVLELGCGTGGTALRLAGNAGRVLATDFSQGMIDQALLRPQSDNVTFLKADAFDPALDANSFDVVLALNVVHLVLDTPAMFARVAQLLSPGGLFISKTPSLKEPGLGWKFWLMKQALPLMQQLGKAPYVRMYDFPTLEGEIMNAGFRIVETGNYPLRPPNHFVVAQKT